jgi:hypothetical protein
VRGEEGRWRGEERGGEGRGGWARRPERAHQARDASPVK